MIPQSVSPKCTSLTVANRAQQLAGRARQRAEREPVELVQMIRLEVVVDPHVEVVEHDRDVVGDRGELHRTYQGRSRRSGNGLVHHRPENRQRSITVRTPRATDRRRGQDSSMAATIAATSSSVGSGVMPAMRRSVAHGRAVLTAACSRACAAAALRAWCAAARARRSA